LNGLPVRTPHKCLELKFKRQMDWAELREAVSDYRNAIIFTKAESVWAWGHRQDIRTCFGDDLVEITEADLPEDFQAPEHLHFKAFIEEALIQALTLGKPLLPRMKPSAGHIIVDAHAEDVGPLTGLQQLVSRTSGIIPGLLSPVSDWHPEAEKVYWAESLRVSLDRRDGRSWLLLEPDVWIWPSHARAVATEFLDKRKSSRFNKLHNELLQAWSGIILGPHDRNADLEFQTFDDGDDAENPTFLIGARTAFSRRVTA
jgi:hypothetical protein